MAAEFSKAVMTYVVFLLSFFFALRCNALDIDMLSEFIETFNLVEIAHSVEVFQNTQGIHERETILDRAQECLVAIGIVLADEIPFLDLLSLFKIESNLHWILSSLRKEIIDHSYSLCFPKIGTLIVILHTLHPTEATFE